MICNSKKLSAAFDLLKASNSIEEFKNNLKDSIFEDETIEIFKNKYTCIYIGSCLSKNRIDKEFKEAFYTEFKKIFGSLVCSPKKIKSEDVVKDDTTDQNYEDRNYIENVRDADNRISSYKFIIKVQDKPDLSGILSREEMELIYNLYSVEGSNLTQRTVSRYFPQYTLRDFKRILRAFNVTKASSPIPPHMMEEKEEDELVQIALSIKENNFLKKLEQEKIKANEKKVEDLTKENLELKNYITKIGSAITTTEEIPLKILEKNDINSNRDIILHLSDLHIGAKVSDTALFKNEYNYHVIKSRLENLVQELSNYEYDTIIVNLLGDMLDGMDGQTARKDHVIPQNMDNFEQVKNFISLMTYFTNMLFEHVQFNNIKFYSVPCGNHTGITEYVAMDALFTKLKLTYNIESKLFDEFFGYYEHKGFKFILTHGKDSQFMKKSLPLNLTPDTKSIIYDWLEDQGITGKDIHFIKGDLHSDNLNSCYKLDYRNVLSLFGGSDYSAMNYARNNYGVSYEIIENNRLLRGIFTDL